MNPFRIVSKLRGKVNAIKELVRDLHGVRDLLLFDNTRRIQLSHPNHLNAFGKKCFSQADEDGITLEIIRRLGMTDNGVYAEYGVGNGMENNTLILAALGWRGFWVGSQELKPDINSGRGEKFQYARHWITLDNIKEISEEYLSKINRKQIDVLSMDLDGNDIHFIRHLLDSGSRPKLFIVEYNAKFPPPIEFEIAYDPEHTWGGDDYFGASLSSLEKLFREHGYKLICCNAHSGTNAFFVDGKYSDLFTDVPDDIEQIYVAPRYIHYKKYGHISTPKTIERIFDTL